MIKKRVPKNQLLVHVMRKISYFSIKITFDPENRMNRLRSLDVFRGMTVALMIIVNNPGDWDAIYAPLEHATWHGCTPTDLVFPFFLFIVGVSIVFALSPSKNDVSRHPEALKKVLIRALKLFSLGLFLNFYSRIDFGGAIPNFYPRLIICAVFTILMLGDWPQKVQIWTLGIFLSLGFFLLFFEIGKFENARIPGVLQRISLVYLIVSWLFLKTSLRTQIYIFIGILLGYWAMMAVLPVPGFGAANFNAGTNFATWVDGLLGKHCYTATKTWDPEGVLSTLPAICTGLAGVFAGKWLKVNQPTNTMLLGLLLAGATLAIWGQVWDFFFPINKPLWTSSYVFFTAGLAAMLLAVFYWLIDVQKIPQGFYIFFLVYGVNAMTVFFGSGLIPRLLNDIKIGEKGSKQWLYENLILPHFAEKSNASLAAALTFALIWFVVLWIMWKKKVIIKV